MLFQQIWWILLIWKFDFLFIPTIDNLTISSRNFHADFFMKISKCVAKGIAKDVPNSPRLHPAPVPPRTLSINVVTKVNWWLEGCIASEILKKQFVFLKNLGRLNDFIGQKMSQIKAKICLRTNVKLIFHKNVGWQGYPRISWFL